MCWTLAGFASGYLSVTEGRPTFVLEDRCIGKGDAACHFRARGLAEWGDEIKPHLSFYKEAGLTAEASGSIPPQLVKAVDEILGFIYGLDQQAEQTRRKGRK